MTPWMHLASIAWCNAAKADCDLAMLFSDSQRRFTLHERIVVGYSRMLMWPAPIRGHCGWPPKMPCWRYEHDSPIPTDGSSSMRPRHGDGLQTTRTPTTSTRRPSSSSVAWPLETPHFFCQPIAGLSQEPPRRPVLGALRPSRGCPRPRGYGPVAVGECRPVYGRLPLAVAHTRQQEVPREPHGGTPS